MVKIGEADKRLDLLDIGRDQPPTNGFGFSWVHRNSLWRHHKSKELDRSGMEQRLLWLDVKVVFTEACEHTSDVIMMKRLQFRVHEDVIQIDHHEHVRHILEDVVHEVLKRRGGIGKSHWHDQEFEGAIASLKCCLLFVAGGDANVVVTGA